MRIIQSFELLLYNLVLLAIGVFIGAGVCWVYLDKQTEPTVMDIKAPVDPAEVRLAQIRRLTYQLTEGVYTDIDDLQYANNALKACVKTLIVIQGLSEARKESELDIDGVLRYVPDTDWD